MKRSLLPTLTLLLGIITIFFGIFLYRQNVSKILSYNKKLAKYRNEKQALVSKLAELQKVSKPDMKFETNLDESFLKLTDFLKNESRRVRAELMMLKTSERGTKEIKEIAKASKYDGIKYLDIKATFNAKENPTFLYAIFDKALNKFTFEIRNLTYDKKRGLITTNIKLYGTLKEEHNEN